MYSIAITLRWLIIYGLVQLTLVCPLLDRSQAKKKGDPPVDLLNRCKF